MDYLSLTYNTQDLQPALATEDDQRRKRLAALTGDPNIQLPTKGLFANKFMKRALDRSLTEAEARRDGVDDYDDQEVEPEEQLKGRKVIGSVKPDNPAIVVKQFSINGELVPQVSVGHKARVSGPINTGRGAKNKTEKDLQMKFDTEKHVDSTSILNKTDTRSLETITEPSKTLPASVDSTSNPWIGTDKASSATESDGDIVEPQLKVTKTTPVPAQKPMSSSKRNNKKQPQIGASLEIAAARPLLEDGEESSSDSADEQSELLRRAFAEDDVVEEYIKENTKAEAVPVALTMPGWGSWVGDSAPHPPPLNKQPTKLSLNKQPTKAQPSIPTLNQDITNNSQNISQPSSQKLAQNITPKGLPQTQSTQKNKSVTKNKITKHNKPNTTNTTNTTNTNNTNKTNTTDTTDTKDKTSKTNATNTNNNTQQTGDTKKKKRIQLKRTKTVNHPVFTHENKAALTVPTKYQVTRLPSVVSTEAEFTRDIRTPVGKEWTPAQAHQALTAPRIISRSGVSIAPIAQTPAQESKYKQKAEKYVAKYHKKS